MLVAALVWALELHASTHFLNEMLGACLHLPCTPQSTVPSLCTPGLFFLMGLRPVIHVTVSALALA